MFSARGSRNLAHSSLSRSLRFRNKGINTRCSLPSSQIALKSNVLSIVSEDVLQLNYNGCQREKRTFTGLSGANLKEEANKMTESRPKVVILGAGYAGAACAKDIQKKLGNAVNLTVIERREVFVHKISTLRSAVLGDKISDRSLVPNEKLVDPELGKIIQETVTEVTEKGLKFASGESIDYDYLVCATGSRNFSIAEPPLSLSDKANMKTFFSETSAKIKSSEKIVIVGGGAVGVELAGEIKFVYPNKEVTIVHGGDKLLSSASPPPSIKFFNRLESRAKEMGINLLLGQTLNADFNGKPFISGLTEYETSAGNKIEADLVLLCAGVKLTTEFYPSDWLNERGQVKVNDFLQLEEHPNVFAVGDLNSSPESKQAVFAAPQGSLAAENIKRMIGEKNQLKKYGVGFGTNKALLSVTVGPKKGAAYVMFMTLGSYFTSMLKGKDLFVKENWTLFNQGSNIPVETIDE